MAKPDPTEELKKTTPSKSPDKQEIPTSPNLDTNMKLEAPSYQAVTRGDDNDEKTCRICLEDDDADQMISPCRCKGSSKWVHRDCLDMWRTNEHNRAFAQCTECTFRYHLQPKETKSSPEWRRKAQFAMLVSRDICAGTIILQLVIAALGFFTWVFDRDQALPELLHSEHPVAVYYLFGIFALLVLLGISGSVSLCRSGCSPSQALAPYDVSSTHVPSGGPSGASQRSAAPPDAYRRARHRRGWSCCDHCYYYHPYPYYPGGDPGCCCCCCCDGGDGHSRSSQSCDCCDNCGNGCGSDAGDGLHVLLVGLAIVAIVLAVVGFVVGMVLTVIIGQRIIQRHVYLLHKAQLAQEFQVMDLSGYDLEQPLERKGNKLQDEEEDIVVHPPPSAPPLPETDQKYLKSLGLV